MRMRGLGTLRRLAQPYTNLFLPGPIILLYHRVAHVPSDPQLLCVTPEHFAEQLEVLRKQGYPIRLQELGCGLRDRKKLPRGVAVTFDDGYEDNLTNAKPLLERHDVPATVFVTTGYVNQQRGFWWDELEMLLLHRDPLPKTLRLHIDGMIHDWDLTLSADCNRTAHAQHSRWNISESHDPSPRHALYRALHKLLRPLLEDDQRRVLDRLRVWAGIDELVQTQYGALSRAQILDLAKGGLIEVGCHSVTHPIFSVLSAPAQREEVERSKADLEEIIGLPVTSFAYPFGSKSDYTDDTASEVERAGFLCACANFPAIVTPASDRYQLPRFLVRDWDGDEFSRRLGAWLS